MAITTMAGLTGAIVKKLPWYFNAIGAGEAGTRYYIMNMATTNLGVFGTPAAASSGGQAYNQGNGGIGYSVWSDAPSGAQSYITKISSGGTYPGNLFVYDLLWACSGFSGTVTTPQTITGFTALPTRAGGSGSEIWLVVNSATSSTAGTVNITYTNQSGTSGRTTQTTVVPAALFLGHCIQLLLQAGDTGVQSIQSLTLNGVSIGTAALSLFIMNRICCTNVVGIQNCIQDFTNLGLPPINDSAVIMYVFGTVQFSTGNISGEIQISQG